MWVNKKAVEAPPEELPIWGAQGVGKTFDSATDKLYKTTQQPISWAHIGDLIITTRALEKDGVLDEVMDVLNRYSETRSEVMLYATDDELPLLAQGTPILGNHPGIHGLTILTLYSSSSLSLRPLLCEII